MMGKDDTVKSMKTVTINRRVMLGWTLFQGVGAVAGGTMGMLDPNGASYGGQSMVDSVHRIGFDNLLLPAAGLFALIGIGNLAAAALIKKGKRGGAMLGCAEGLIITGFTAAEIAILGKNSLSIIYGVLGMAQFACGLRYLKVSDEHPDPSE